MMIKRIFNSLRKAYYFVYYCNYQLMNRIADRSMKNSLVHGFTWPSLMLFFNLMALVLLFSGNSVQLIKVRSIYVGLFIFCFLVINYFVFDYKNRGLQIIEEYKSMPSRIRYVGVVFFTLYSIFSIFGLLFIAFAGWQID
jgi:hypothetical protein